MNKIKNPALFSLVLILLFSAPLFAADGVQLSIRLYNQKIYFPGDDIEVRITISNDSPDTYRFKLADNRLHNLDFDVRSMDNSSAEPSPHFITALNGQQMVSYRDVNLLPGEELSFIEKISDYRVFDAGIYMVHALFYPELRQGGADPLISNTLSISVREGFRREDVSRIRVQEAVSEEMQKAALPPDEVVAYTIEARMHSEEDKFLQYLDVERLYTDNQRRAEQFARLSALQRQEVLSKFKDQLWQDQLSEGISLIPMNYTIQQTTYGPSKGTVTVEQRYDQGEYIEVKRFTYDLERRDGIWYIVRYQVINLGTE